MARYRKIDPRIWNDAKFGSLSDDAKLVFLLILTHPHMTSLGAMRSSVGALSSDLKWKADKFQKAFREAFAKGLVEYDEKACFVGLPKFLKYNQPESPNVVKSWESSLDLVPECGLKVQLVKRVKGFLEGLTGKFQEALPEAFAKALLNQEQEQEQEQESKKKSKPKEKPTVAEVAAYCTERGNGIDAEEFVAFYESKNWMIGKNKMTNWKQAVITWEKRNGKDAKADRADERGASPMSEEQKQLAMELRNE